MGNMGADRGGSQCRRRRGGWAVVQQAGRREGLSTSEVDELGRSWASGERRRCRRGAFSARLLLRWGEARRSGRQRNGWRARRRGGRAAIASSGLCVCSPAVWPGVDQLGGDSVRGRRAEGVWSEA
ncbi:uncharacterized protein A4U43_C09F5420 [Asparagus officinalis]|uniref:Uncharacterized protein n=1 Tax=Asparagus officinalis TaxID=4686 RepID=A0A5P1E5J6_ASPOF|nr:uncharacterized protein A4U43_C09F5420 [Asparagus officinalis]